MTSFFEHTNDGALIHQGTRYVAMRADVLVGAVAALDESARGAYLAALSQSARINGGKSVARYAKLSEGDRQDLLRQTALSARRLGWGAWRFRCAPLPSGALLELSVRNSPFAAAGDGKAAEPLCAAIQGILASLGALLCRRPLSVREVRCKGQGYAHCDFEVVADEPAGEVRP